MLNRKNREKALKAAEAHRANMQKNLQERLAAARSSGNDDLVRQLEAEANYIGLN